MTHPGRSRQPNSNVGHALVLGVLALGFAIASLVTTALMWGTDQDVSLFPPTTMLNLAQGRLHWSSGATVALVLLSLFVGVAGAVAVRLVLRHHAKRTRVDGAARLLGRGKHIASLTAREANRAANRMGVDASAGPGLPLGVALHGNQRLYSSWEDTQIHIWGPRTGKSTCLVIPAILEAPGAVIATSNKRDLVDATRHVKARTKPVWVFDPQELVSEPASWWWNPLSYVTDDVTAINLAELFAAGSAAPDAKTDAFFDPEGKDVLAQLLLAAALEGRPVTDVYDWITRPSEDAVVTLRRAGYELMADGLASQIAAPDRQRAGVFGTAKKMAGCLRLRAFHEWVTDDGRRRRHHLDVAELVGDHHTLHLLSKEGAGTGGPLVAALTVAVIEEAERQAIRCPGGRLPTPLVAALDEAANIVRWPQLPNLYSHYGSRGIVLATILQSWSQGVECWGAGGMKKLWSAANIKTYGGGVSETEFLRELSELVGDHEYTTSSVSSGRGGGSVSRQTSSRRILTTANLTEWPRGRALVSSSGNRATIVRTEPWMTKPYAPDVKGSIEISASASAASKLSLPLPASSGTAAHGAVEVAKTKPKQERRYLPGLR
ncbi:UNVERIFIED_CONTAM: type IV secretory pathway TraG/TraD family ATPase VirD4 [Williamsia faeni]